jgi:hypothetical protein
MKKIFLKHVAALLLATTAVAAYAQAPVHHVNAQNLVTNLRAQGEAGLFFDQNGVEYNKYGASWSSVKITYGYPAYAQAVCSNFVTRLLMDSYQGWTAKSVGFSSSSPNSAAFYDAVESNTKGFTKVTNFANWQPGDLMFAKYFDGSSNSGHTMLVNQAVAGAPAADGSIRWSVQVIDCSSGTHTNDTRVFANYKSSGVGMGWMYVYTNGAGQITAYSWSQSKGSTIYTPATRALTLGRFGS